jgi:ATP-dependent Clp endopeptidase proteolytic subunit ClpP
MKANFKLLAAGILAIAVVLPMISCHRIKPDDNRSQSTETLPEEQKIEPTYFVEGDALIVCVNDFSDGAKEAADVMERLIISKDSSGDVIYDGIKVLEVRIGATIGSTGGNIYPAFDICDKMERAKKYVVVKTVAQGDAVSSAALIFSSGTKGERYIGKNGRVMIHDIQFRNDMPIWVNRKTLDKMKKEYEKNPRVIEWYGLLSENTGQTVERIKKDCYEDTYFTASEAIAYGLADKILP